MVDHADHDSAAPVEGAALPHVPEAARQVYGARLEQAQAYVAALATTGVSHGLIGPREVPRLWERHVLNCAVVESLVPQGVTVVDIGSGAGLPGLALAIARPDLQLHLVEPMQRRTDWLSATATDLGLGNVAVHHARAQDVIGRVEAPVATARAVTRIGRLAGWCAPLLSPGGTILAIKGASITQELADDAPGLRRVGVVESEVLLCGEGVVEQPTTVARLRLSPSHRPGRAADAGADLHRGRAGKGKRRSR